MRFKIDENLPAEIAEDLRSAGHEADTVASEGLAGAADPDILARVKTELRTILTLDKGMANIRQYPPDEYPGIVLFRPTTTGRQAIVNFVRKYLPTLLQSDLAGHVY